jgi:hypothetical protein
MMLKTQGTTACPIAYMAAVNRTRQAMMRIMVGSLHWRILIWCWQ